MFKGKDEATIRFMSNDRILQTCPHPTPAAKNMPKWYKSLPPTLGQVENGTMKRCIPALDAVSQGYIIPLWCDLLVQVIYPLCLKDEKGNTFHKMAYTGNDPSSLVGETVSDLEGKPIVHSVERENELSVALKMPISDLDMGSSEPIGSHPWEQVGDLCSLKKFKLGKTIFKLNNPWAIRTKEGWSCYFKKPPNNFGCDLEPLEGVVDTDQYDLPVNFPSVWTGSEEGEFLLKKGTPLVQVIPFKRERSTYKVEEIDEEKFVNKNALLQTMVYDRYKRMFWHKRKRTP